MVLQEAAKVIQRTGLTWTWLCFCYVYWHRQLGDEPTIFPAARRLEFFRRRGKDDCVTARRAKSETTRVPRDLFSWKQDSIVGQQLQIMSRVGVEDGIPPSDSAGEGIMVLQFWISQTVISTNKHHGWRLRSRSRHNIRHRNSHRGIGTTLIQAPP